MKQTIIAIACLVLASCASAPTAIEQKSNAAIDNILSRTSVRSYTSQKPSEGQIDTLLRAAMASPTARNLQPWGFVVVDDRAILDSLSNALPYAVMLGEAQVAIVVCGNTTKAMENIGTHNYWEQDCSAATENLLLAANALGLGAVWIGVFPNADREAVVRTSLNLPSHLIPLNIVSIGYPDEPLEPKDKYKPENIYRNRF